MLFRCVARPTQRVDAAARLALTTTTTSVRRCASAPPTCNEGNPEVPTTTRGTPASSFENRWKKVKLQRLDDPVGATKRIKKEQSALNATLRRAALIEDDDLLLEVSSEQQQQNMDYNQNAHGHCQWGGEHSSHGHDQHDYSSVEHHISEAPDAKANQVSQRAKVFASQVRAEQRYQQATDERGRFKSTSWWAEEDSGAAGHVNPNEVVWNEGSADSGWGARGDAHSRQYHAAKTPQRSQRRVPSSSGWTGSNGGSDVNRAGTADQEVFYDGLGESTESRKSHSVKSQKFDRDHQQKCGSRLSEAQLVPNDEDKKTFLKSSQELNKDPKIQGKKDNGETYRGGFLLHGGRMRMKDMRVKDVKSVLVDGLPPRHEVAGKRALKRNNKGSRGGRESGRTGGAFHNSGVRLQKHVPSTEEELVQKAIVDAINNTLTSQRNSMSPTGVSAVTKEKYPLETYAKVATTLREFSADMKAKLRQPQYGGLVRAMRKMTDIFVVSECGMFCSTVSHVQMMEQRRQQEHEKTLDRLADRKTTIDRAVGSSPQTKHETPSSSPKKVSVAGQGATGPVRPPPRDKGAVASKPNPSSQQEPQVVPGTVMSSGDRKVTIAPDTSSPGNRRELSRLMNAQRLGGATFDNEEFDLLTRLKLNAPRVAAAVTEEADKGDELRPLYNKNGGMLGFVNVHRPPLNLDDVELLQKHLQGSLLGLQMLNIRGDGNAADLSADEGNNISEIDYSDAETLKSLKLEDLEAPFARRGLPSPLDIANAFIQYIPSYFVELRHIMRVLPGPVKDIMNPQGAENFKPVRFLRQYPFLFTALEPKFERPCVRLNPSLEVVRTHRDFGVADRHLREFNIDYKHRSKMRATEDDADGEGGKPGGKKSNVLMEAIPTKEDQKQFAVCSSLPGKRPEPITYENVDEKILQILVSHLPRGVDAKAEGKTSKFFALVPWINSFPEYHLEILNKVPQERVMTVMNNHPRIFQVSSSGDNSYFASVPEYEDSHGASMNRKSSASAASHEKDSRAAAESFYKLEEEKKQAKKKEMTPEEKAAEAARVKAFSRAMEDDLVGMDDILLGDDIGAAGAKMTNVDTMSGEYKEAMDDVEMEEEPVQSEDAKKGYVFFEHDEEIEGVGLEAVRVRRQPAEIAPRCCSNHDFASTPAPELLFHICHHVPPPPCAVPKTQASTMQINTGIKNGAPQPIVVSRSGGGILGSSQAIYDGFSQPQNLALLSALGPAVTNSVKMLCAFWTRIPKKPKVATPQSEASTFPHTDFRWVSIQSIYASLQDQQKKQLKDFKGLTNFLRMHGALFEVSADRQYVIAHDPTRREGNLPPLPPNTAKLIAGERLILPLDIDKDEGEVVKGATLPFVVGHKEMSLIKELLGDARGSMPQNRTELLQIDPTNPLLDAHVLAEEIALLLPDHEVTVEQVFRKVPQIIKGCLPYNKTRFFERSPFFSTWKNRRNSYIQRAELGSAPPLMSANDTCTLQEAIDLIKVCIPVGGRKASAIPFMLPLAVRKEIKKGGLDMLQFLSRFPDVFFVDEGAPPTVHLVEHLKRFQQQ